MDKVELVALGVSEERLHRLGWTCRRDEHVIIVEERLAAFNRVFCGFKVLCPNVVVAVFTWLPFGDAEVSEFLDV